MLAAPGCWSLYAGLEDWKIGLSGPPGIDTAQWMIDSYAVQHATSPDRRNRQSVAVHLMSLCAHHQGRGRRRGTGAPRRGAAVGRDDMVGMVRPPRAGACLAGRAHPSR